MLRPLLSLLLFPLTLFGWWDGGHMAAAKIAYAKTTPKAREKIDALQKVLEEHYPAFNNFTVLAIWADEVKHPGNLPFLAKCHFTNLPYDPENVLSHRDALLIQNLVDWTGVVSTIKYAQQTLKNIDAPLIEKAIMLALLIHCVADIHQPLHCTSRFSKKFPFGDLGGTLFQLTGCKWKTLHELWDSGAGAFPSGRYMEKPFDTAPVAARLTKIYPAKKLPELKTAEPEAWAVNSRQLAIDVAYDLDESKPPSKEYLDRVQKVCERQIALSGYRLAAILNETL